MLTFTGQDVLVAEQRQKDMVERARQYREAQPRVNEQQSISLSSRWLYAFGEQLVSWGCQLQTRYRQVLPQRSIASRCGSPAVRAGLVRQI